MNRELLRKFSMFISSSLIASSNLLLIACDDKVPQAETKQFNQTTKPVPNVVPNTAEDDDENVVEEPQAKNENVGTIAKDKVHPVNIKGFAHSEVASISSGSEELLFVEEKKSPEAIILDLSLNLDLDEQYFGQGSLDAKSKSEGGELEEDELNFEMEIHFERPHIENKERETTPDGIGVGIKVGI